MGEPDSVWVRTEPTHDEAGYVVTIGAGDDLARTLSPDEAMTHARGVLAAVARAEYDSAVLRQMLKALKFDRDSAVKVLGDLRADRPPLDPGMTAPIALEPGVNAELEPFLALSIKGERVGQWTMADAREHAFFVLTSVAVADHDTGYLQVLLAIGLDRSTALNVVADLAEHRS